MSTHRMLYEVEHELELREAREKVRRWGKQAAFDKRGRPILPRWPLITGIVPFLFHSASRVCWAALSLSLVLAGGVLLDGIGSWLTWQPRPGDFLGGMQAMAGLAEMLLGSVFTTVWLAAASSVFLTIVSESAAGSDRVHKWPAINFIESMGDLLYAVTAVLFSSAPGWLVGQFAGGEPAVLILWTGGSFLLLFPLVYLSQLSAGSPTRLLDRTILAGMARCPLSWLLFYLEATLIIAACAAVALWSASVHRLLPIVFAPVYIAAGILYARLLGRLGWRMSETLPG